MLWEDSQRHLFQVKHSLDDIYIKFKDVSPDNFIRSIHNYIAVVHFNDYANRNINLEQLSRLTYNTYDNNHVYTLHFPIGYYALKLTIKNTRINENPTMSLDSKYIFNLDDTAIYRLTSNNKTIDLVRYDLHGLQQVLHMLVDSVCKSKLDDTIDKYCMDIIEKVDDVLKKFNFDKKI